MFFYPNNKNALLTDQTMNTEKKKYISGNSITLFFTLMLILLLAFLMRTIIMDDAYISLRYAHNLLSGNGLVFNIGEKIEGITNIGWTLFLIPFISLFGPLLAVKMVGVMLVFATVYLLYRTSSTFEGNHSSMMPPIVILMTVTQLEFILFSLAGMETALMSCLLCIIIWMVEQNKSMIWIAGICSTLFLVHPEAILVYILARIFLMFSGKYWKRFLKADFFYLGLIVLYSVARFLYYRSLLPNTFQAKESSLKIILINLYKTGIGNNTNIPTLFSSLGILIMLILGIISINRICKKSAAFLGATLLVGFGFSIYAPVDWTGLGRYIAPYLPLVILVFWHGVSYLLKSLEPTFLWIKKYKKVFILGLSLAIILPSMARIAYHLHPKYSEQSPGFVLFSRNLVKPVKWIKENTSPDSIIACRRIGALGFYSQRYIFDYLFGLTDRSIAKVGGSTPALIKDPVIGKIWRHKSPDYYLEDRVRVKLLLNLTNETEHSFHIQGIEYKLIKSFIIGKHPNGDNIEWWLCEKTKNRKNL